MNWDAYEIYHPGVTAPLNTLGRAEARRAFDRLMEEKPARVEMLRCLLGGNGVELGSSDAAIHVLNDWFRANVAPDSNESGRLLAEWYSVVNDIGVFLGDVLIDRCPWLRWEFYIWGKKDASYQRHVIMGFRRVPNPKYNVDIDRRVATYGHRIVASRGSVQSYGRQKVRGVELDLDDIAARHRDTSIDGDVFVRWLRDAEAQA